MEEFPDRSGYNDLWNWFSLSRASFLVLARVLMHEMPDDWQGKMAALLHEFDVAFPNQPEIGCVVRATKPFQPNRLVPMPEALINYRHPDRAAIEEMRHRRPRRVGGASTGDRDV